MAGALLSMLDRTLFLVTRPGDDDQADIVEDRYGNRVDTPANEAGEPDVVSCRGATQLREIASGEPETDGGRNSGIGRWLIFLEPTADVSRVKLIEERAGDVTSGALLHQWQIRSSNLLSDFGGVDSHWEISAEEHT